MANKTTTRIGVIVIEEKLRRGGNSDDVGIREGGAKESGSEINIYGDGDRVLDQRFPLRGSSDEGLLGWRVCFELSSCPQNNRQPGRGFRRVRFRSVCPEVVDLMKPLAGFKAESFSLFCGRSPAFGLPIRASCNDECAAFRNRLVASGGLCFHRRRVALRQYIKWQT